MICDICGKEFKAESDSEPKICSDCLMDDELNQPLDQEDMVRLRRLREKRERLLKSSEKVGLWVFAEHEFDRDDLEDEEDIFDIDEYEVEDDGLIDDIDDDDLPLYEEDPIDHDGLLFTFDDEDSEEEEEDEDFHFNFEDDDPLGNCDSDLDFDFDEDNGAGEEQDFDWDRDNDSDDY